MPIRMLGLKGGGFDRGSHIDWRKEQVEVGRYEAVCQ